MNEAAKIVQWYNTVSELWERTKNPVYAETLDTMEELYPNVIRDYDEKGNYVGSVANENGWTP